MKVVIIPARGGSKRIPRKNIKPFAGKPMIAWSIEAAIKSDCFDKIIVSTDDQEIAEIGIKYGAEVPFMRPDELSDDYAGTTEVIAHAISSLNDSGSTADLVCCLYPTAPFVQSEDLHKAKEVFEGGNWEYVFSATDFGYPIFRAIKMREDCGVEMFYPEHFQTRSQDLPHAFHDAGQFYFGKPSAWLDGLRIFEKHSCCYLLPRWRVQDIDTPEDWERAERIFQAE